MNANTETALTLLWLQLMVYFVHLAPHGNDALAVAHQHHSASGVANHNMLAHT
jgi:hypothetical protein